MRCAILGGAGFLGQHVGRALAHAGWDVWCVDRAAPPLPGNAPWFAGALRADCFDLQSWWGDVAGVELIVHLASSTVPATASQDPMHDVQTNLLGTLRLLQDLRRQAARPRVLFASSGGAVYGRPQSVPLSETHPTLPISAYGATKLAIEHHLHIEEAQHGLPCRILRLSNPYGEWQPPHGVQGVIAVFAHRALHGLPLDVYGDGSVVRDFIYAADVGRAFAAAAHHAGPQRVFNVGGGAGHSVNDIIHSLERLLGHAVQRRVLPARPFDPPVNVLDIRRAREELRWQPTMALEDGLAQAVAWLRTVP
ncbi:NAD-dependent epimerase/dehydratase family protein [Verminephrobacter aporrectodeae subsp. tuberculatae]|uniref:NAD-dependent epimerase/dehydratase family protein n=1 Tax=Verminephrobacter aporrectodeae TaxID=1110389 RepID=UPI002244F1C6|nr:NAD-dependent epimerase/dehydratase family protein [Verminephrobacter aporrectodeae]MCW8166429.1 NAD-dependent epimerase/dehydratase family protein [Verminephrobacter aporrectodeae subsp. tuberculatae]MCW8170594.1 NAD-dependent epimerase/dehydratase family protein [Verminephrobacter aporrectodeae subsp. tuberculatae]